MIASNLTERVSGGSTDWIGYVDGSPVPRALLDDRLARLRSGLQSGALPLPGTAEDRQLARWVTQVVLTEQLCSSEASRLGLPLDPASKGIDRRGAVELGSIYAAAYGNCGAVRAVCQHVTSEVSVDELQLWSYWRSTVRSVPAQWVLRHRLDDGAPQRLGPVSSVELPAALAEAVEGTSVGSHLDVLDHLGQHEVIVEEVRPAHDPDYARDAPALHDRMLATARRATFVRWLDLARATRVTMVRGLEHPGDPGQPDNHHKH
jgi:[acyl-carrier-protein] S-malonyltransferase